MPATCNFSNNRLISNYDIPKYPKYIQIRNYNNSTLNLKKNPSYFFIEPNIFLFCREVYYYEDAGTVFVI